MINTRSLMGDQMLAGGKRIALNVAMVVAIVMATIGCGVGLYNTTNKIPGTDFSVQIPLLVFAGLFVAAVIGSFLMKKGNKSNDGPPDSSDGPDAPDAPSSPEPEKPPAV